jgi:hypothetical protein
MGTIALRHIPATRPEPPAVTNKAAASTAQGVQIERRRDKAICLVHGREVIKTRQERTPPPNLPGTMWPRPACATNMIIISLQSVQTVKNSRRVLVISGKLTSLWLFQAAFSGTITAQFPMFGLKTAFAAMV